MIDERQADTSLECAIVNVSSISATVASVNRGEYCISKGGCRHGDSIVGRSLGRVRHSRV